MKGDSLGGQNGGGKPVSAGSSPAPPTNEREILRERLRDLDRMITKMDKFLNPWLLCHAVYSHYKEIRNEADVRRREIRHRLKGTWNRRVTER